MRRIVEDPEQHQWIGSVMPGEVRLFQAEAERNGCHEGVTELSHRCEVFEDDRPELRQVRGKKIRTVQGRAGLHERMSGVQLRAEIDALFHVGISRCEFTPTGKYPRHARPPRDMAISSFAGRSCAKNRRLISSSRF